MQADRWGGSAWSPWQSHPFIYVNNNPMVFVDPYGLWSWSAFGTGFLKGAGAGLAYGFASGSISAVAQIVAKAVPGFGSVILACQIFNTAKSVYGLSQMASQLSQIKMSDKQQSELVGNIVGGVVGSVIGGKAGKKLVNKYKSQIESAIRNYVPDKYLKGGNFDSGTVFNNSTANVDSRKFSDYIFKEGADHGKDHVFKSLGYSKENSSALSKIYMEQAGKKFLSGSYSLGKSDEWGQRINIEIELPGIGSSAGKFSSIRSGWLILKDGTIKLATPFSGFIK
jgi:hypothetical protein